MQRIGLLNGNNITYDYDVSANVIALLNQFVISGFGVSGSGASAQILPGKALIECTRTNGQKIMAYFESDANVPVDMTGTKKVYIAVTQAKIDDGSANAEDGTGVASIQTGASYPASNYIPLYSITAGVITNEMPTMMLKSFSVDGVIKQDKGSDIASASTVDLSSATGNTIHITGTTTITSFGNVRAGAIFNIIFDGSLTLTHNATSLILPTQANIQTIAGDSMIIISEGGGNWRSIGYFRADGTAIGATTPIIASTQSTFVAGENITAGNALRNGRGNTLNITSINNLTSATDIKSDGTRIGYSTSEQYIGQSFTLTGVENYLNSISVKLGKSGSPTGNLTMKIYSDTGTTLIATSSNTISESSIVASNTYTFNFADYIPTGIPLYIRIETSRANSTSAYSWIYFSSTSSITGDFYQISSANSWSILSTYDMGISINTSIIEDTTQLYKTNALLSTTSNFCGFATNTVSTGGNVIVSTSGVSNTQSGLTIGSYYYLSDTAGAISTTPGTNIVSVGKAVSTTGIEINNNFVNNDTIIISLQQNFATTTVINHNLGRIPEKIEFQHISAISNLQHSKGIYKNGTNKCIYYYSGTSPYAYSDNTKCCKDGYGFTAYVSAVTSTTFTLVNTANSGSSSYLQIIATLS